MHSKWTPKTKNNEADLLSRQTQRKDWGIDLSVYDFLYDKYSRHEIDAFASHYNTKCQKLYSKSLCPETGIDAFSFKWPNVKIWFIPQLVLILKLFRSNVVATLVVAQ